MVFCIGDSLKDIGKYTGAEFDDVYSIDDSLNSGAFGDVYKAHLVSDPTKQYAVKIIEKTNSRQDEEEAIYEAQVLYDMRRVRNVVKLVDFFVTKDNMYMVQKLAEGGDVFDRIVAKETYTEYDTRDLAQSLLRTVRALHKRGVVHRDLKPENILLRSPDDDTDILLCDFGSAKYLPKDKSQGLSTLCGTPAFTAPELVNNVEYREEVDMWSIGCVLFMALGGYLPFDGGNDAETYLMISQSDYTFDDDSWKAVSKEAKHFITKLLALDREHRWDAMEALNSEWFTKPIIDPTQQEEEQQHVPQQKLQEQLVVAAPEQHHQQQQNQNQNHRSSVPSLRKSQLGLARYCARRKLKAAVHVVRFTCSAAQIFGKTTNKQEQAGITNSSTSTSTTTSTTTTTTNNNNTTNLASNTCNKLCNSNSSSSSNTKMMMKKKHSLWDAMKDINDFDFDETERTEECTFSEDYTCSEGGDNPLGDSISSDLGGEYYDLQDLQNKSIPNIDYKNLEKYLSDEDFQKVFKAPRSEVATWKPWRVQRCKRSSYIW